MDWVFWTVIGATVVALSIGVALFPLRRMRQRTHFTRACADFHRRREMLEAKFFQLAAASGKPRGLRWSDVDFQNDVTYVRDRGTRQLSALVGVTISFEAIEGGGMEEVEAVSNLRAATAVFQHNRHQWATEGRAIFNLNPAEALRYYQANLELVGHEAAAK